MGLFMKMLALVIIALLAILLIVLNGCSHVAMKHNSNKDCIVMSEDSNRINYKCYYVKNGKVTSYNKTINKSGDVK